MDHLHIYSEFNIFDIKNTEFTAYICLFFNVTRTGYESVPMHTYFFTNKFSSLLIPRKR